MILDLAEDGFHHGTGQNERIVLDYVRAISGGFEFEFYAHGFPSKIVGVKNVDPYAAGLDAGQLALEYLSDARDHIFGGIFR